MTNKHQPCSCFTGLCAEVLQSGEKKTKPALQPDLRPQQSGAHTQVAFALHATFCSEEGWLELQVERIRLLMLTSSDNLSKITVIKSAYRKQAEEKKAGLMMVVVHRVHRHTT